MGLALESFGIIYKLEQGLGRVRDNLRESDSIAMSANFLIRSEQILGRLVMCGFVLCTVQVTAASIAITERDACSKLRAVQQRIRGLSNTRRIIGALIVIRERAPLGARIYDATL